MNTKWERIKSCRGNIHSHMGSSAREKSLVSARSKRGEAEDRDIDDAGLVVGSKEKSTNVSFSDNPTPPIIIPFFIEEARVHAHVCGDGSVWLAREKRSKNSLKKHPRKKIFWTFWIMNFTSTCKELRDEFERDMKVAFNRKCTHMHNELDLRVRSVKHILRRLRLIGSNSKDWFIPPELFLANERIKREWIRAFFDDEGTIREKGLSVCSVNKHGLLQIKKLLNQFRILSTLIVKKQTIKTKIHISWVLRIRNKCLVRFHRLIGFRHPKKKMMLEKIVSERIKKNLKNF